MSKNFFFLLLKKINKFFLIIKHYTINLIKAIIFFVLFLVGNSPSSYSNTSNNVKLAANFISNNSNTSTNMLTNFVGDMTGCNINTQQFNNNSSNNNFNNSNYQQQQQNQFYMNKLYTNETVNNQLSSIATPNISRRELLLSELKQHQQQQILMQQQQQQQQLLLQQQQHQQHRQNTYRYDFDDDEDEEEQQERLLYSKRRSITSSPVRYNFNSKSSPPVIMRIDSAKTARLNRLRSSDQQKDSINYNSLYNNNNNSTDQQQINTPSSSTIEPWSKNR